ncbi:MAG: hypothetical protein KDD04_09590, partial [Sinomicrobium sp.]|nr:hypothetical protein [Sinomicrobium sp.]
MSAQDTIGGIVNIYTRVLAQGDCPGVLTVADAAGFEVGQTVLVISMQGGVIRQDDDASFGQLAGAELSAGLYDWSSIRFLNGNEITLAHSLSNGYDFSQAVQLVGIPHFQDAVVTEELTPLPWDGTIGGVLALEVMGKLSL